MAGNRLLKAEADVDGSKNLLESAVI